MKCRFDYKCYRCLELGSPSVVQQNKRELGMATKHRFVTVKGPRMNRAVVDLGSEVLGDILYHRIKPAVVMSYVLRSGFYRHHPLTPDQMSSLANASMRGDYSKCDITLVYSLLRNLTPTSIVARPTEGMEKPISPDNTFLRDDVERIWEICNEFLPGNVMSDSVYEKNIQELSDICQRMDTVHSGSLATPSMQPPTYYKKLEFILWNLECKYLEMEANNRETMEEMENLIQWKQTKVYKSDAPHNVGTKGLRMNRAQHRSLQSHLPRSQTFSQTPLGKQMENIDPAIETEHIEKFQQMQVSDKETLDVIKAVITDDDGNLSPI